MKTENIIQGKTIKIGTWLPVFSGFYGSLFDINDRLYSFENDLKKNNLIDKEKSVNFDYSSFNKEVINKCIKWVLRNLPKESGIHDIKLESIYSPKEYNFKNDSANIEIEIDTEKFSVWFNRYLNGVADPINGRGSKKTYWLQNPNKENWEKHLRQHYQSRSGFISFYPSNAETWAEITNNYRFDYKNLDPKEINSYFNLDISSGTHSLGRCLEFYLENENDNAYEEMYFYCSEKINPEDFILNAEDINWDDFNKTNCNSLFL